MISGWFSKGLYHLNNNDINFLNDNLKIMLVNINFPSQLNRATQEFVSTASPYELSGNGYGSGFGGAGRIVLTGKSVSLDANGLIHWNAADLKWNGINAGIIGGILLIKENTSDTDSLLLFYFGQDVLTNLPFSTTGRDLPISFGQQGLFTFDSLTATSGSVPFVRVSSSILTVSVGPIDVGVRPYIIPTTISLSSSQSVNQNLSSTNFSSARIAYRFTTSGVSTYPVSGAVYKESPDTGRQYCVIANGTNLVVANLIAGSGSPPVSGTLSKISGVGDSSITFTSRTQ